MWWLHWLMRAFTITVVGIHISLHDDCWVDFLVLQWDANGLIIHQAAADLIPYLATDEIWSCVLLLRDMFSAAERSFSFSSSNERSDAEQFRTIDRDASFKLFLLIIFSCFFLFENHLEPTSFLTSWLTAKQSHTGMAIYLWCSTQFTENRRWFLQGIGQMCGNVENDDAGIITCTNSRSSGTNIKCQDTSPTHFFCMSI